jgi:two-component system, NtrC family, C4-dicarboxylate transport response regulator DctD
MTANVFFVDDEKHLRTACSQSLELAGFEVNNFASADGVLDGIDTDWAGVLVSDIRMAGTDGLALMAGALKIDPDLPVILITGHGDVPMAVKAMRDGAYDFIEKPFAPEVLVDAVRRGLDKRSLILENRHLREALTKGTRLENRLVGQSLGAIKLREKITQFAAVDADVLVVGETGTGKEQVAQALHELSPRGEKRFVPVNCGALPETMIESELFGHEKGAFTGADQTRIGKFEYADGGTVFLDEIESMPLDIQVRLLRVLEERKIVHLGSNTEIPFNVRIIASSKGDLRDAVSAGRFRDDLYYRLNVLTVSIPPLRDRPDDIPMLVTHFINQDGVQYDRAVDDIPFSEMKLLMSYVWPGNVRELRNCVRRYVLGQGIELGRPDSGEETAALNGQPLSTRLATFEKKILQETLQKHGGRLKLTYEELGVSRKTLYDKLKKYRLENPGDQSEGD